uniref:Uncharacterized protein n=1 Tax=Oryza glumipatula TaxID=40148 RepID=A0A0D9Y8M6_9ORYZ
MDMEYLNLDLAAGTGDGAVAMGALNGGGEDDGDTTRLGCPVLGRDFQAMRARFPQLVAQILARVGAKPGGVRAARVVSATGGRGTRASRWRRSRRVRALVREARGSITAASFLAAWPREEQEDRVQTGESTQMT